MKSCMKREKFSRKRKSKLTIVDRLVPVDVDRTKLEPEVIPGVTKFTHFIFADGATRTPSNDAEVQICEKSFGPDRRRRGMATSRSKNSSRSDEREARVGECLFLLR